MDKNSVIIQGLDPIDIAGIIAQKNKKFCAIGLQAIEEILGAESSEFKLVRKEYLSNFNNYTRSVVRAIFGDIELDV